MVQILRRALQLGSGRGTSMSGQSILQSACRESMMTRLVSVCVELGSGPDSVVAHARGRCARSRHRGAKVRRERLWTVENEEHQTRHKAPL